MTTDPTVLVVGAGPAGLTLAIELARRQVAVRIIDVVVQPPAHSRALALQTRTVEVLDRFGIADTAIARGQRVRALNLYASRRRLSRVDLGRLDSPFPFTLALEQPRTEQLLRDHLAGLGVVVERGVELVSLIRMPDGVAAELRKGDTHEQVRPAWLAGCDGAHSTVRQLPGLPFEGASYPDEFLLGDMHVDWALARDEGHGFLAESGLLFAIPLDEERYRLISTRPVGDPAGDDQDAIMAAFRSRVRALAPAGTTLRDPVWLGSFHVHRRLVSQLRSGRVFLVGDAAHIHSPAGGLGLNDAVQDAANLGWKLALAASRGAPMALLDTYHAERHPLAQATLRGTDVATRAVTSRNRVLRRVRRVLPRLLGFGPVQRLLVPLAGQLQIVYPHSPFVEDGPWHGRGVAAGHRAPDAPLDDGQGAERLFHCFRDPRHVLLLFEGLAGDRDDPVGPLAAEVTRTHGAQVAVHVVRRAGRAAHERYGATHPCCYLIRPDGYVGFRAKPIDAAGLTAHLGRLFPPARPVDPPVALEGVDHAVRG